MCLNGFYLFLLITSFKSIIFSDCTIVKCHFIDTINQFIIILWCLQLATLPLFPKQQHILLFKKAEINLSGFLFFILRRTCDCTPVSFPSSLMLRAITSSYFLFSCGNFFPLPSLLLITSFVFLVGIPISFPVQFFQSCSQTH